MPARTRSLSQRPVAHTDLGQVVFPDGVRLTTVHGHYSIHDENDQHLGDAVVTVALRDADRAAPLADLTRRLIVAANEQEGTPLDAGELAALDAALNGIGIGTPGHP